MGALSAQLRAALHMEEKQEVSGRRSSKGWSSRFSSLLFSRWLTQSCQNRRLLLREGANLCRKPPHPSQMPPPSRRYRSVRSQSQHRVYEPLLLMGLPGVAEAGSSNEGAGDFLPFLTALDPQISGTAVTQGRRQHGHRCLWGGQSRGGAAAGGLVICW